MTKTIWHCHIAISLDGKIARADGSFDWLEGHPPQEFGIDAFMASIDAILMGRHTCDVVRRFGDWPYAGKQVVVMTHRRLVDPPEGVESRTGDLGIVATELEARGCRRVWVEGGGQVIRGMIAAGRLDVLKWQLCPSCWATASHCFPPARWSSNSSLSPAKRAVVARYTSSTRRCARHEAVSLQPAVYETG